ncbi:hypothetical protein C5167_023521, partial [Papaver somniferum]
MSGVQVNGGNKRQLPSWMLGATRTEQTEKPKKKNEKTSTLGIQQAPKVLRPKRIPLAKKEVVGISEDSVLKMDSNVLVKCRTRKRKPASERLDLDDDDEIVDDDEDVGLRKKRTRKRVEEVGSKFQLSACSMKRNRKDSKMGGRDECLVTSVSEEDEELTIEDLMEIAEEEVGSKNQLSTTAKKRNRKANKVGERDESLVSSPNEEDEELTVKDLMTIAEEYVKADEGNKCQQSAAKDPEPTQLPVSFEFSRNDSRSSIEPIQTSKDFTVSMKERSTSTFSKSNRESSEDGGIISSMKERSTSTFSKNNRESSEDGGIISSMKERSTSTFIKNNWESSEDGGIISSQSRTGDSTQDMLDLFLGPLLRIPQTAEKKSESITEDFNLACEPRKQKQSEVYGEEVVPLTKKKSSLKDK